jgi:RNA polymerase sigma factor for flagellar operon FliA
MDAENFLIEHLAEIDRAIAFVCRRNRLKDAEAEDFGSLIKLRLIENDYGVIRKFEARCSFHSYIMIVVQRILLDERDREFGKWRPSAEAQRLGGTAVLVETLLRRDKQTIDSAVETLRGRGIEVTRHEIEDLERHMPERKVRPRRVPLEHAEYHAAITEDTVAARAEAGERAVLAGRIANLLHGELGRLPARDRLIFRMHFEADMTVADIARALQIPQKPIYRLMKTHLGKLRRSFEREGIAASDIDDIIGMDATPLDGHYQDPGVPQSVPPVTEE